MDTTKKIKGSAKDGAEFLRNMVNWLNARNEYKNDNKSLLTLIKEYRDYCKQIGL